MITQFPVDFNPVIYDLKTSDGIIWSIVKTGDIYQLQSGDKTFDLMPLDGRFTFFTGNYQNVNLHGFDIAGMHYEITEAVPNENWVEPPPVPEVPEIFDPLVAKEQAFAAKLLQLATAFGIDITALPDINIGTMLQAAQQAGATESEIANASAILMALFNDVVVEAGGTSADAWAGLKSRLPGYLQEV